MPELIADYECHTGENPLWHHDEQRLYWVDIPAGHLFRYDPKRDLHESIHESNPIGGFTLEADGALLLFEAEGRIRRWDGGETETVVEAIPAERNSRFNDVIADPRGRVFAGSMPTEDRLGRLYRVDVDGAMTELFDGVDIPNGLGFTGDCETVYFTESEEHVIYRFDYDEATGILSNRRVFVDFSNEDGVPDGLTVDAEGYVWSARWDGGCVVRYAPDGTEKRRIDLPAQKVSSVTFGGTNYNDLYVTTGGGYDKETEGRGAGALFRLDVNVSGRPEYRSTIGIE